MCVGFATLRRAGLSKPGLDFEEQFDADASVLGIGAVKAEGLLLTAHKVLPN